jgi:Helix-turn-helix domain
MSPVNFTIPANEHLVSENVAADYLGFSVRTLQRLRLSGEGPIYRRLGKRRLAYLRSDLVAFVQGRSFSSTSAEGYSRKRAA